MNNLYLLVDSLDIHQNKQIILAGYFNLFLDTVLGANGNSPCCKNICCKINENKETFSALWYFEGQKSWCETTYFQKKTCFWLYTTKIGLFSDFKQSANGTLLYTPSKMLSYMVTFFTKFLRLKISRHAVSLPFYLPSPTAQFFNFAKWRH